MDARKETPGEKMERYRQEEYKNNPNAAFSDGVNRAQVGSLADLASGLGWKGTGVLILLLVIGFVIYKLF